MTRKSAEPQLYSVDDDGTPTLTGTRDSTGYISFPQQTAGSLLNGDHGAHLSAVPLSGRGEIHATATVRFHPNPDIDVPFTVASIVLEEGPMVRGILDVADSGQVDDLVVATTAVVRLGGEDLNELRFRVAKGTGS
ncbi:OB-fold domain-containing protein [Gordonia sp. HY285]|uniref:Zn-ribbon domain-containing OB-fold protein n=1 Tax=Gordonia liuliyuniae TaxID=2911517 RepID=UPI001F25112B|nr:OB-fold domain-containing protein [Gordonia liuliyuniae]MCF8608929.1 OB-fold domain-containing protein [Gordonia liuliyuniae]